MSALGGEESVSLGVLDSEKACLEIGAFFPVVTGEATTFDFLN